MKDEQAQMQMRWGVWHDADDCWLASLDARNAELLPLVGTRREQQVAVPRIVHQIWLGPNEIPARCREWMQTWTALHPTWDYVRTCAHDRVAELKTMVRLHTDTHIHMHAVLIATVDR